MKRGIFLGLTFVASVIACQSEEADRPAPISDGLGRDTTPTTSGSMGGEGGESATVATTDELEGSVSFFNDDTFDVERGLSPYSGISQVHVISFDGNSHESFDYDGTSFDVSGVEANEDMWIMVEPTNDDTIIPTITKQDTRSGPLSLQVVERSILEEMLAGFNSSETLNETSAHLIVQLLDVNTGEPIFGVTPQVIGSNNVAFAQAGPWSDDETETTDQGMFFAYNVLAASLPGQDIQILLEGRVSAEVKVRAAAGALTFVQFVL